MSAPNRLENGQVVDVEIGNLKPPSWKLRPVREETVLELERSIRNSGLLQPIVVRRKVGGYEIVFGNHRFEACRRLGMNRIPSILKQFTDDEAFLARVSENLVRNEYVDPIEEAEGYSILVNKGWTINAIGKRVGKCDSYICERLALLRRLSKNLRNKVSEGSLTASHAELLSRVKDVTRRGIVAELVERKRLSVRTLESLLGGIPPPARIRVENIGKGSYVRIPPEFASFLGIHPGLELFAYLRGNKLVLDGAQSRTGRRRNRNRVHTEKAKEVTSIMARANSTYL